MKKKIVIVICCLLFCLVLAAYDKPKIVASSEDALSETYYIVSNESNIDTIYTQSYQDKIYTEIEKVKKVRTYTLQSPLLLANPYGTNTTGVYMYFTTGQATKASYTISVDGYQDFSQTLKNDGDENYTTKHEYLLIGCIPGKTNKITVTLTNPQGDEVGSKSWTYDAPELLSGEQYASLTLSQGESLEPLSNGLYTVLGNDETEYDVERDYIFLYDNQGIIRAEIPIQEYRSQRILFKDNKMYYSCSYDTIVEMERTGRLTNLYSTGNYDLHHDYTFDQDGNILVLASLRDGDTKEDRIIKIDTTTKQVQEVIDLASLLPEYLKTATLPKGKEVLDWMHINSITSINDSIIISSRETSTILKIDSINKDPKIDYMIGSSNFWKESGYDDLLLQQVGSFSLQAGQHCVTYQSDDSLKEGQYYLYMYNNNNTCATTQPNYSYQSDSQYQNTGVATKGENSYYYKYLVDENTRSFTLVSSIAVAYSGYVSSSQEYQDNIIIDSGSAFTVYEYDSNHRLIQSLQGNGGKWLYRVFKYDYKGFWFN